MVSGGSIWRNLARRDREDGAEERGLERGFPALLAEARSEWLAACALFETVVEPDLIEHAIHLMAAAERKYAYLLQQAKEAGVRVEPI